MVADDGGAAPCTALCVFRMRRDWLARAYIDTTMRCGMRDTSQAFREGRRGLAVQKVRSPIGMRGAARSGMPSLGKGSRGGSGVGQ